MKRILIAIVLLMLTISAFAQGPFGFERGMTRDQIVKLVGGKPAKINSDIMWDTDKSPIPNSHFESYILVISPTQGLLKVVAIGKDIETSDTGAELKGEFEAVHTGVVVKYGAANNDFDLCNGGTGCSGPDVWMLGLMEKNAKLASFWLLKDSPTHITTIALEAKPTELNKGYCSLTYEFEGWEAFIDARTAKQNQSF